MRLALLALLAPSLAFAQTVTHGSGTVTTGPRVLGENAFAAECPFESGLGCSPTALTTTRASTCYVETASGWTSQAANVACVGLLGLNAHRQTVNLAADSTTPWAASWQSTGTPTGSGAEIIDDNASAYEGRFAAFSTTTATSYTVACYVRAGTTNKARIRIGGNGTGTLACTFSDLTSTSTRKTCGPASLTGLTNVSVVAEVGNATSDTGSIFVDQCQLEAATAIGPRHDCGATSCTRNADIHSVPTTGWPTSAGDVRLNYTPIVDGSGTTRLLLTAGSNFILYATASNTLRIDGGGSTVQSAALTWTTGTTYTVRAVWSGGTATLYRDGVQVATGAIGSISYNATANVGSNSGGTSNANGAIKLLSVSSP